MTIFSKPLQLDFDLNKSDSKISHASSIFLVGSCFSDNIADKLLGSKFNTLSNPFGVSYNPVSITKSIQYFVANKKLEEDDLFLHNELYKNWDLHSSFASLTKSELLQNVNTTIAQTHDFLKKANFVFITLGTAYVYELNQSKQIVANCHKAPANWFTKRLLSHNEIVNALQESIQAITSINKNCEIYFTVSPVRHVRDGVVENNRSKALLFSAIHQICETENANYFPSFELVNDVLRDYRFFADDLVHPNSLAIDFVWENFVDIFCNAETKMLMQNISKIKQALQHKILHPNTEQHKKFVKQTISKIEQLHAQNVHLDFSEELSFFVE
ncbi:MAG: GSCFA domain-containing protein [Bacteroidota bacterium]